MPDKPKHSTRRLTVMLVGSLITVLWVWVWAWSGPAHAQSRPDDDKAKAAAVFDEGMQLFNRGAFAAACDKFEASVDLFAGIGNRGKLAECYERVGRLASAWRLYRDVAKQARRMNDDERAEVAAQRARALESRLARLTVEPGPTVATPGFAIHRNHVEQPERLFQIAMPIDPGSYRIQASAPGHEPWSTTVLIAEGESKTVTVPRLAPMRDQARRGSGQASGRWGTGRIVGLSLVSVGAVSLLGGSTYYGWSARSKWADVPAACRDGTGPCTPDDIAMGDEAERRATRANLFGAVGVAAVVAGGFIWWRSAAGSKAGSKAGSDDHSVQVMPSLGPDLVGVVVRTSM